MDELSRKWKDLSDIQQATIIELVAGKHQGNVFSSLMANFQTARDALNTSLNSSGSAMAEHAKWSESLEARLNKLKSAWQSLSQTFMNSSFLKLGIDLAADFVNVLDKLIDRFGLFGAIGLGAGIYGFIKNFGTLKTLVVDVFTALTTNAMNGYEAWTKWSKASDGVVSGSKTLAKSMSAITGAIGLVVAVIGVAYNAYKNAKEAAAEARQEAIQASDEYLEAASSFEKAYIKYSGKTDLTADEEAELESAIKGTAEALDDKSSALQGVVNSSNDYLASLEQIADEEIKAAARVAKTKRDNAEIALKEAAIGWESADGSEVDIKFRYTEETKEALDILQGMDSEFYDVNTKRYGKGRTQRFLGFELSGDADVNTIIDYYNTLLDYQERLSDADLIDTDVYDSVTSAIDKMSESIKVYVDGTYEAAKANYQFSEGIPKTTDEYIAMREAILGSEDIAELSIDTKMSLLNSLDSEYAQLFDLSSAEAQARKFVGIINGYGDGTIDGTNEIGTVETFLNMRTAVNNNECTVGQYLSELNKVNSMTAEWSEKEREEFNLAFGIDTDTIKAEYKKINDYIWRNHISKLDTSKMASFDAEEYRTEEREKIQEFLSGLTAKELSAVIDIKAEIDWANINSDEVRQQIEERVKINEALNFKPNLEIDTTALEALNTALSESASAIGLTTESINSLESKYSDLEGYDAAKLFEATANGVKVNREELAKLEKEHQDLTKSEVQEYLDTLTDEYNKLTAEIDKNTNASERAQLISERDIYADKIKELATYQAQLEGVTGAYQRWLDAQNASESYEGYEAVATSRENVQDEIKRGFLGNATKEYIDLLSGEDLRGGTIDDYANAWERLDDKITSTGYSIHDFFTLNEDGDITATGIHRFFESVRSDFEGEVYKLNNETGEWYYDFSEENLKAIQDTWGMGVEAIELMLEATVAAGYNIDWGGILDGLDLDTSDFETLVSVAESAQEAFNKLESVDDVDFNFTATGVEEATIEIEKARNIFDSFINEDGTVNLEAEGAEEIQFILSTLLIQKQQLSTPAIMRVDTSQIDQAETEIIEVINAAKNLQSAYENYEIAISTGVDVEKAQTELNNAISALEGTNADIRANLKLPSNEELQSAANGLADITVGATLDGTAVGALETKIQTECTPEVIAKVTGLDETAITNGDGGRQVTYTPEHQAVDDYVNGLEDVNRKVIFTYTTAGKIPNPSNINRTITYTVKTSWLPIVNGTANANGTTQSGRAFARGDWGIKGSGTALVGELGMETLVRDGHFYTIGDSGAEFVRYRQGDIIFNHRQTEELFKNGKVTSDGGRGKMFVNGSAFADGSYPSSGRAFWKASASQSNFSSVGGVKKEEPKPELTGTKKQKESPAYTAKATESKFANDYTSTTTSNSGGGGGSSKDKFEETIDWIETKISRIERVIDKLDQKVNNVYKSWSERNQALVDQIENIKDEIELQQQAYDRYMQEAASVGLDSSYVEKIRNGEIDIETITDEDLKKKIDDYQKYYESALECQDAIEELKEKEAELYAQRLENVSAQYEGILGVIEHEKNMLDEYISQAEARGHLVSANYYEALASNERNNLSQLEKEKADMLAELQTAMESGSIEKGSEAWYDLCSQIDEVTLSIAESETALLEYEQTIQQLSWETFDILQEKISAVTEEADFLIELMSSDKLYDDNGKLTDEGMAVMGLHGQNYNAYMHQADAYGDEIARLDEEIAKDPYDQDLVNRRQELLELQQEAILAAQDEKEAIRDMVSEGIELELDALQELIDKKNEALESERDLYEYQKKVKEQTEEIASLEKQMAAYQGDDSEEAKQKIQQIKVDLETARQDLQETEYDKFISDSATLLDELYLEYEEILNMRLDNLDALVADVITQINADATTISNTISEKADSIGYTLSDSMKTIWDSNTLTTTNVITTYGEKFSTAQTTTNNSLSIINTNLQNMITQLNTLAKTNVKSASISSATNSSEANAPASKKEDNSKKTNNNSVPTKTDKDYYGVSLAIWNGNYGWGNGSTRTKRLNEKGFDTNKIQKIINKMDSDGYVHSGSWSGKYYGIKDLMPYHYNKFAVGVHNLDKDQFAWTQEKGREFIVRPSDGAILTPLAKGDSVFNASASNNLWEIANSPSEFIKDNLNLGVANIPNNSNVQSNYTQYLDKVVFNLPNVKSYDELLSAMQKDKNFERLVLSMTVDRLAGKSSLAKGKTIH